MIPVHSLVFTGPSSPSVLINPQWVLDATRELKHLTIHLLELHTLTALEATGKHLLLSLTQWLVTPEASDLVSHLSAVTRRAHNVFQPLYSINGDGIRVSLRKIRVYNILQEMHIYVIMSPFTPPSTTKLQLCTLAGITPNRRSI